MRRRRSTRGDYPPAGFGPRTGRSGNTSARGSEGSPRASSSSASSSPIRRERALSASAIGSGRCTQSASGPSGLRPSTRTVWPGLPTTVELGGTSWTTTALAPIFAPWPIRIGPRSLAPEPIVTLSSTVGWRLPVANPVPPSVTPWYSVTFSPISAVSPTTTPMPWSMNSPSPTSAAGWISMPVTVRAVAAIARGASGTPASSSAWATRWASRAWTPGHRARISSEETPRAAGSRSWAAATSRRSSRATRATVRIPIMRYSVAQGETGRASMPAPPVPYALLRRLDHVPELDGRACAVGVHHDGVIRVERRQVDLHVVHVVASALAAHDARGVRGADGRRRDRRRAVVALRGQVALQQPDRRREGRRRRARAVVDVDLDRQDLPVLELAGPGLFGQRRLEAARPPFDRGRRAVVPAVVVRDLDRGRLAARRRERVVDLLPRREGGLRLGERRAVLVREGARPAVRARIRELRRERARDAAATHEGVRAGQVVRAREARDRRLHVGHCDLEGLGVVAAVLVGHGHLHGVGAVVGVGVRGGAERAPGGLIGQVRRRAVAPAHRDLPRVVCGRVVEGPQREALRRALAGRLAGRRGDRRRDVVDRHRLGVGRTRVAVRVLRRDGDGGCRRGRQAVGERALERAGGVVVGARAGDQRPAAAAVGLDRLHGVLTRIGDGVAVGVRRALVDRTVVRG